MSRQEHIPSCKPPGLTGALTVLSPQTHPFCGAPSHFTSLNLPDISSEDSPIQIPFLTIFPSPSVGCASLASRSNSPLLTLSITWCFVLLFPCWAPPWSRCTPVHALLAPGRPETQCHCHSLPLPSSRASLQLPLPPPPSILLFFAVFCGLSLASASAKAPEQTTLNLVVPF